MHRQLLFGLLALIAIACIAGFGQKSVPTAAKVERISRFQVFYSPHMREDTFLVDTMTGKVWRQVATENERKFVRVSVKPSAPPVGTTIGRYAISFSPSMREDTYLVDTLTGKLWAAQIDDEDFYFNAVDIEGVTK